MLVLDRRRPQWVVGRGAEKQEVIGVGGWNWQSEMVETKRQPELSTNDQKQLKLGVFLSWSSWNWI